MTILPRTFATKYRKTLAVTTAVGLHLVLLAAFSVSSSDGLPYVNLDTYGDSEVEGISVDLIRGQSMDEITDPVMEPLEAPSQSQPQSQPQNQPMSRLMQMTEPPRADGLRPISQAQPTQSLSDVFGENLFKPSKSASAPAAKRSETASPIKVSDKNSKTLNDLWKQIEPCWKRTADKNTLPVTLEVSFSPLGNLSKPPVIKRSPTQPLTDQALRSESQAITALSQCGPYLMAFGQEGVQVKFPKR